MEDIYVKDHAGIILDTMEKEAIDGKQKRINYGVAFSTKEGFEVLCDIAKFCHACEPCYVRGDQFETALREGERNVFLYILSLLSDEMKQKISIGG